MNTKFKLEHFLTRFFYGPVARYQHVAEHDASAEIYQIVSFQKIALVTLMLPLWGFTFCIVWSLFFNFTDSTSTHCGVDNYLPSVSASIGAFSPQKYVWRLTIALHSAPRYLVSLIYYRCHNGSAILLLLNCIEISFLLGLTIVSSTEQFTFHAAFFLLFISSSFAGMVTHLLHDNFWSRVKLKLFLVNSISWMLALFFYVRHNQFCETGVYTLFAAAEYSFVVSNMLFHFQAYFDFTPLQLSVSQPKIYSCESKFSV